MRPTITQIVFAVAGYTGISVEQIRSTNRTRTWLYARRMTTQVAHRIGYSYPEIARAFGRKHHSTFVGHANHDVAELDIVFVMDYLTHSKRNPNVMRGVQSENFKRDFQETSQGRIDRFIDFLRERMDGGMA